MRNSEIASLFDELAERIALLDGKPFRAAAYARAADLFRSLHISAAKLSQQGKLGELDGVGPAIEQKVAEALETGTFTALDDARAQVPDGLIELVRIPGVGEKTARRIWAELEAQTIGDVFAAAHDGRLGELKGVGPKVIGAVRDAETSEPDVPNTDDVVVLLRSEAVAVVDAAELICQQPATASGDYARGCELVRDLVIVITADSIDEPLAALTAAGWELLSQTGDTARRMRSAADVVTRMACASAEDAEAAVAAHAGPEAWSSMQLPAAVIAEQVPLELRDAVIDGAQSPAAIPADLVTAEDLTADLHDHSTWSDGTTEIIDLARAARDRGDSHLLISDHSAPYALVNGLDGDRIAAQAREIHAANDMLAHETQSDGAPAFAVLQGSEVEIRPDGSLGLPDDVLQGLDWVVASVHMSQKQSAEQLAERMRKVCSNPLVDCIGHPTSRLLLKRDRTALDIDVLIELARDTGTILEINANPMRLDLDSTHARMALAAGIKLAINTDAHSIANLDYRPHGVGVARRAGARACDVVNTLTRDELEGIRPRHRG